MWKLHDLAEGTSKEENAKAIKSKLEELKLKVREIKALEVGINTNDSMDSYDVVLYSEFDSIEDLARYQNHPEHVRVGDFIGKVRQERKVVDYEV